MFCLLFFRVESFYKNEKEKKQQRKKWYQTKRKNNKNKEYQIKLRILFFEYNCRWYYCPWSGFIFLLLLFRSLYLFHILISHFILLIFFLHSIWICDWTHTIYTQNKMEIQKHNLIPYSAFDFGLNSIWIYQLEFEITTPTAATATTTNKNLQCKQSLLGVNSKSK